MGTLRQVYLHSTYLVMPGPLTFSSVLIWPYLIPIAACQLAQSSTELDWAAEELWWHRIGNDREGAQYQGC